MPKKVNQILILLFTIFYCNVFAQVTPNKAIGVTANSSGSNLYCGNNWLNVKDASSVFRAGDIDITGNKLTVEAFFNRTQTSNSGNIVSKHKDSKDVNYLLRPNRAEITTT